MYTSCINDVLAVCRECKLVILCIMICLEVVVVLCILNVKTYLYTKLAASKWWFACIESNLHTVYVMVIYLICTCYSAKEEPSTSAAMQQHHTSNTDTAIVRQVPLLTPVSRLHCIRYTLTHSDITQTVFPVACLLRAAHVLLMCPSLEF
jgi:hypothetical protein